MKLSLLRYVTILTLLFTLHISLSILSLVRAAETQKQNEPVVSSEAVKLNGKFQDAAESHRETIRLKPDLARAHYNLGMALLRMNETKSARAEFQEAHRLDSSLNPPAGISR